MAEKDYRLYIINDISEKKSDAKIIEDLAAQAIGITALFHNYIIIGESEIRRKVYAFLEMQEKYDLIFTGDRGGTMIFPAWELERFGTKVARIAYSMHHLVGDPFKAVFDEVSLLGRSPRILIIESELGRAGTTKEKLNILLETIEKANKDSIVHIIIGVGSKNEIAQWRQRDYVKQAAYPVEHQGVRLSEMVEKYAEDPSHLSDEAKRMFARAHKLLEQNRLMKMTPRRK
jgi:hypothetical protein